MTPIVRKLAKQHGVDLATVTGSGVGGRIRKQDILDAAEKNKAAEAPAEKPAAAAAAPARGRPRRCVARTDKLTRLRKTIATRMVESLQVSAQLTQVHEVDVTEVVRLRARHKDAFLEREGVKLTYLPFFAKAAIEALKQYPQVNAALDLEGGTVTYPDGEHLSIAVDTERGLLAPTIKDAGDLNIAGLARKIADIAERTRNNKILPDELSGGDVLDHEPGQQRRPVRHADHQPAAGRDPGRRRRSSSVRSSSPTRTARSPSRSARWRTWR